MSKGLGLTTAFNPLPGLNNSLQSTTTMHHAGASEAGLASQRSSSAGSSYGLQAPSEASEQQQQQEEEDQDEMAYSVDADADQDAGGDDEGYEDDDDILLHAQRMMDLTAGRCNQPKQQANNKN